MRLDGFSNSLFTFDEDGIPISQKKSSRSALFSTFQLQILLLCAIIYTVLVWALCAHQIAVWRTNGVKMVQAESSINFPTQKPPISHQKPK